MKGFEIAAKRAASGLKAKDVAKALQVSPTTVSRWENSTETLKPLVEAAILYVILKEGVRERTPAEKIVEALREALMEPFIGTVHEQEIRKGV